MLRIRSIAILRESPVEVVNEDGTPVDDSKPRKEGDKVVIRQLPETEKQIPALFDGFVWPVEGVIIPNDDFLSELKDAAYLDSPYLTVEWRERQNQKWIPFKDRLAQIEKDRPGSRVGGPSPATGPAPGPSAEAIAEARARGIFWNNITQRPDMAIYDEQGNMEHTSHCAKCGGMLPMAAVIDGHLDHESAGTTCLSRQSGTEADQMIPPEQDQAVNG